MLDTEWSKKKTSTRGSDITSADTWFKRAAKPLSPSPPLKKRKLYFLGYCTLAILSFSAAGNSTEQLETPVTTLRECFRFSVVKPKPN